jgi:hypothetical protein
LALKIRRNLGIHNQPMRSSRAMILSSFSSILDCEVT